ncbi:MAG: hypothetical protein HN703_08335 [Planctomycetaceae bacterium]|nr:hypothetical protein [Planctomycetaceae bacterium]
MLVAKEFSSEITLPKLPNGVDIAIIQITGPKPDASWKIPPSHPTIAWNKEMPSQRQECDRFQAVLANRRTSSGGPPSSWDWAGFLVGN